MVGAQYIFHILFCVAETSLHINNIFPAGSMTGLRREIAKHVVLNILETLNENDFVNVFNFSTHTTELVPCFNDSLVQVSACVVWVTSCLWKLCIFT